MSQLCFSRKCLKMLAAVVGHLVAIKMTTSLEDNASEITTTRSTTMNRTLATLFLTATISATLGVTSLQAQNIEAANIPFAFQVQSQTMPAGRYVIKQLAGGTDSLFSISDSTGHSRFLMAQLPGKGDPNNPKLTFACHGAACSLAKISFSGSDVSHGLVLHDSNVHLGMATEIAVRLSH